MPSRETVNSQLSKSNKIIKENIRTNGEMPSTEQILAKEL